MTKVVSMAKLQNDFMEFHDKIKLDNLDENSTLKKERDILLYKLRRRLKKYFEQKKEPPPSFEAFDQGSYAMGTGTQPMANGNYDIDVGLYFHIAKEYYPDPVPVKQWIYEALTGNPYQNVVCRNPCVTVFYQRKGKPNNYQIDLAIYFSDPSSDDGTLYLAKGKLHSRYEERIWEKAEPKQFLKLIRDNFLEEEDKKQFIRVIRYLKRWKDVQFPETTSGEFLPLGMGLTVAAYYWFNVSKTIDVFTNKATYDDVHALKDFIKALAWQFTDIDPEDQWESRLIVTLPVAPYSDIFEKMTDNQMIRFRRKLKLLLIVLVDAETEPDPYEASHKLQEQFGEYFPVPTKEETASKSFAPAIVSSSSSAKSLSVTSSCDTQRFKMSPEEQP